MAQNLKRYFPHILIAALALLAIAQPATASERILAIAQWFLASFGGLTLALCGLMVVFCIVVAISPAGKRRLGGEAARPEFRTVTWLGMLFATGMGAGLVFWGAAEPLIFYASPPPGGPQAATPEARRLALALTQFHWAIHAWSIYAVGALVLAVMMTPRSTPLPSIVFPEAPRPVRRVIDWLALAAIIFGIVASVGQGVFQLAAGAERLTGGGLKAAGAGQYVVLLALAAAWLTSTALGLRRGIATLSNLNICLAALLSVFVFVAGPTADIVRTAWESLTSYFGEFLNLSTTLREEGAARQWTRDWSLTYFLWWVAWAPFVGVFVARISRGRTLREFVLGVVLAPVIVTLVWFSIFGGAALSFAEAGVDFGIDDFSVAQQATYRLLEELPLTTLSHLITFLLTFFFIVTSADSAAYVLGMFSRGHVTPPVGERVFWGALIAVLTGAALLSEGGQSVTRAFAVTGAIPLTALLLAQMVSVVVRRFRPVDQAD